MSLASRPLRQIVNALRDAVEDAEVVAQAGNALLRRCAVAAEHALEQDARVQLHGIGRGGVRQEIVFMYEQA